NEIPNDEQAGPAETRTISGRQAAAPGPRRQAMWRTPEGDRVLTEAEWALFRAGLGVLWDFIEDESKGSPGSSDIGVRVLDVLTSEQKIALLADVGQALRDPGIPAPPHTAVHEGAIAAVFAMVASVLECEVDLAA